MKNKYFKKIFILINIIGLISGLLFMNYLKANKQEEGPINKWCSFDVRVKLLNPQKKIFFYTWWFGFVEKNAETENSLLLTFRPIKDYPQKKQNKIRENNNKVNIKIELFHHINNRKIANTITGVQEIKETESAYYNVTYKIPANIERGLYFANLYIYEELAARRVLFWKF